MRMEIGVTVPATIFVPTSGHGRQRDVQAAIQLWMTGSGRTGRVVTSRFMESDTCRVAIHSGEGHVDVVLPNTVPVDLLMPPLCDVVDGSLGIAEKWTTPLPRVLRPIGKPPLDGSKTLSENGITDGDVLSLTTPPLLVPKAPAVDSAACIATLTAAASCGWNPHRSRAAALMVTVALAGLAGFLTVPGPPGTSHLLLAASAAGVAAAITIRIVTVGRTLIAAQGVACALIATTVLCASVFTEDPRAVGPVLAVGSVGVLVTAGRLTLALCGLPAMATCDLDPDACRAEEVPAFTPDCLNALVLGCASAAAFGIILTVGHHPGRSRLALTAVVAGSLLLRARAHRGLLCRTGLLCGGVASAAAVLVATRFLLPSATTSLCAAVLIMAAAALWCGYQAPQRIWSPLAKRLVAVVEYAVLASIIPLGCSALGLYDTVRVMSTQ